MQEPIKGAKKSEQKVTATEGSQNTKRPKVSMPPGILQFSDGETV